MYLHKQHFETGSQLAFQLPLPTADHRRFLILTVFGPRMWPPTPPLSAGGSTGQVAEIDARADGIEDAAASSKAERMALRGSNGKQRGG